MCEPATLSALAATAGASTVSAVGPTLAISAGSSVLAGSTAAAIGSGLSTAFTVLSGVTAVISGIAGPMMAHSAAQQQADSQREYNASVRRNAYEKAKLDNEAILARQIEEDQAGAQKKFEAGLITRANIATKKTQLEGRGILDTGTGDDLIRDLLFEEGKFTNSVTTNLNIMNRQFEREKEAVGLTHRSTVSGLQSPTDPSKFATGLQIAGNLFEDTPKIQRLSKIAQRDN